MNHYRRQLAAASMQGQPHLQPNLNPSNSSTSKPSAAFDAWSRIAFLNSNPMARNQANPLRGLLRAKANIPLGLQKNININIAQNIHLNPTLPPNNHLGRDLVAEKNTRIRNEINRMIYTNSSNLIDRYACNKCNRSYRNKNHLYRHVRYECDRKKRYQCGVCLKDFYRKDNLKTHISYKHSEYKSANYILINKETDCDDELNIDAHNNNNLVISKNELNEMLNKTDNTQQVLSILNNNESTKNISPTETAQKFLHLKLQQQEQSNLQRSLLLRIQTENNKITQSQSEVLSKLLSAQSSPVQLSLPHQFATPMNPRQYNANKSQNSSMGECIGDFNSGGQASSKHVDFINLEENSHDTDEDDELVEGLEPFVHIDIDPFHNVDTSGPERDDEHNDPNSSKTVSSLNISEEKHTVVKTNENEDITESNSALKSILNAKTINKLDDSEPKTNVERKTDTLKEEPCEATDKISKEQTEKTDDKVRVENNDSPLNKMSHVEHKTDPDVQINKTEITEENEQNEILPEVDETLNISKNTLKVDLQVAQ
ncbi:hypothetical protein M8J76_006131 [Diaphorina citri]|nr:hypothetical protein M8J75_007278 [Diaphorina citri]KAI5719166.1 hypothetical protein M8J76_006131 [Diaphorina citri]